MSKYDALASAPTSAGQVPTTFDRTASSDALFAEDWRVGSRASGNARRSATTGSRRNGDDKARDRAAAQGVIDRAKSLVRAQFDAVAKGGALDRAALVATVRDIARSVARNRYALLGLSRIRESHEYTFVHSVSVSALMIGLAQEIGLAPDAVERIGLAGLLHDIGKSKIPVAVLDKAGPLDADEWVTIKTHPERGRAILAKLGKFDAVVQDVALHHHERYDGSGYPDALQGEAISLEARIAAICDVYDALSSKRAYKDGRPPAEVLDHMQRHRDQFDARLLRAFRSVIGAFPPGTYVRLRSGRVGMVADEIAADPLRPRVALVYHADIGRPLDGSVCATLDDPIVATENADSWTARLAMIGQTDGRGTPA